MKPAASLSDVDLRLLDRVAEDRGLAPSGRHRCRSRARPSPTRGPQRFGRASRKAPSNDQTMSLPSTRTAALARALAAAIDLDECGLGLLVVERRHALDRALACATSSVFASAFASFVFLSSRRTRPDALVRERIRRHVRRRDDDAIAARRTGRLRALVTNVDELRSGRGGPSPHRRLPWQA